jgi:hypothetical protein
MDLGRLLHPRTVAVVVAIPAAGAPTVVEEAGALGCGGAVVLGSPSGAKA